MKTVMVEITEQEADLFRWFRKWQDIIETAKTLKPGSLVIHFDVKNEIKKWEFHHYENKRLDKIV